MRRSPRTSHRIDHLARPVDNLLDGGRARSPRADHAPDPRGPAGAPARPPCPPAAERPPAPVVPRRWNVSSTVCRAAPEPPSFRTIQPDGAVLRRPDRLTGPADTFLVDPHPDDAVAGDSAYGPGRVVQPHSPVAEVHRPQALHARRRPAALIHLQTEVDLHVVVSDARHRNVIHIPSAPLRPRNYARPASPNPHRGAGERGLLEQLRGDGDIGHVLCQRERRG